jgi:hypothetical protein
MNRKIFFQCLFIIVIGSKVFGQSNALTNDSKISVLTIGAGSNLYDAFGHSAIRVQDQNFDYIFNYGVYDFNAPNFYLKFAQGRLNYQLDLGYYQHAKQYYIVQNRTIQEQLLNLNRNEKQQVFDFLLNNYKPDNRFYLYDFFYDNCATKIPEVLEASLNQKFTYQTVLPKASFRSLVNSKLHWNSWGRLGTDLALGSVTDKIISNQEFMFLPEYVHTLFETAKLNRNKLLVAESKTIFKGTQKKLPGKFVLSPIIVFSALAILIFIITLLDYKNTRQTKWLDVILFSLTGIVGIVLALLWFATDHQATKWNYNVLWAVPSNIILCFYVIRHKKITQITIYLKFLLILKTVLIIHWITGYQKFPIVLLPFYIAIIVRYIYLLNYFKDVMKHDLSPSKHATIL